jgi:hypothetical protein
MDGSVRNILAYIMKKDVFYKLLILGHIGMNIVFSAGAYIYSSTGKVVSSNFESISVDHVVQRTTPSPSLKLQDQVLDDIEKSPAHPIIKEIRKLTVLKCGASFYHAYCRSVRLRMDSKTIGTDSVTIHVVGHAFTVDKFIQGIIGYDIIPRGVFLVPHYDDRPKVSWST